MLFLALSSPRPPAQLGPAPGDAAKQLRLLWISCGDKDGLFGISKGVHTYLKEKNVPHVWHVDSGGHTREVWSNDLFLLARRLFR